MDPNNLIRKRQDKVVRTYEIRNNRKGSGVCHTWNRWAQHSSPTNNLEFSIPCSELHPSPAQLTKMDTAMIPSPRRNLKNLLAELHQLTLRTRSLGSLPDPVRLLPACSPAEAGGGASSVPPRLPVPRRLWGRAGGVVNRRKCFCRVERKRRRLFGPVPVQQPTQTPGEHSVNV